MNGGSPLLGPAESRPQGEMRRGKEAADLMLTLSCPGAAPHGGHGGRAGAGRAQGGGGGGGSGEG